VGRFRGFGCCGAGAEAVEGEVVEVWLFDGKSVGLEGVGGVGGVGVRSFDDGFGLG